MPDDPDDDLDRCLISDHDLDDLAEGLMRAEWLLATWPPLPGDEAEAA